jgi:hypothetical protein
MLMSMQFLSDIFKTSSQIYQVNFLTVCFYSS